MTSDLFRLDGAVAVMTGAGGWLGTAMTAGLARAGATVFAVGRDAGRLESLVAPLVEEGLDVRALSCDVTSPQWPDLVADLSRDCGRLDVLVNNAHVGHGDSLRTATADRFDEAFDLSVKAAWQAMRAAEPGFVGSLAAGGSPSVVNVASMYGLVAPDLTLYAGEAARTPPYYGAAKAALLQLTRYAAAELGPSGVRVNAVSPGPFPGPAALADLDFTDRLAARTMLGRVGSPADMVTALLFLASPHSRFVTGTNIVVDGGWTAR